MRNINPDFQSPSVLSLSLSVAPSFTSVIASISDFAHKTKASRVASSLTSLAVVLASAGPLANMTNAKTARASAPLRFNLIAVSLYTGCSRCHTS